ncbi:MAG: hypothetical protein CMH54_01150 [Myxococcales bacterium]|nr:hypothetical protein [Myxococcales bacterium]|tara:strand:- start:770 stop:1201 length:432 start_codon:yes stop_codon:yes gene_type:complete
MKNWHRFLVVAVPLVVLLVSIGFLERARDNHRGLVKELTELRQSAVEGRGQSEESTALYEDRYQEYQAVGSEKAFWIFAVVLASFFVLLAIVFVVLERAHGRKRAALIRSFDEGGLQPQPWAKNLDEDLGNTGSESEKGESAS